MARQFLRSRRIDSASCRFDVLAIESHAGKKPVVRLHKSAFGMAPNYHTNTADSEASRAHAKMAHDLL